MPGLLLFRGFAMRLVPSFHLSFPDVRALRIALASGAVAGLVIVAACSDNTDKTITAPKSMSPRNATASSGDFSHAKHVDLCVGFGSPVTTYHFVNSHEDDGVALNGNGFNFNPPWSDGGDGGDPGHVTIFNDDGGPAPHVAPGAQYDVLPMTSASDSSNCVRVLDRTAGDPDYMNNIRVPRIDSYSAVSITHVSNGLAAVYDHTDCLQDAGTPPSESVVSGLPIAAWNSATSYNAGDLVSTNGGNKNWRAKVANTNKNPALPSDNGPLVNGATGTDGSIWTNADLSDCGSSSNPVRAFANFEHGGVVVFHFHSAPILSACTTGPDAGGAAAATYYGVDNARTRTAFNESEVLTGFAAITGVLHGWYTDEHAMTLGVDSIYVNNKNPTPDAFYGIFNNPSAYAIETMAGHLTGPNPQITAGVTGSPFVKTGRIGTSSPPVGLGNAIDPAGRPLRPGLYLTDLTVNGTNSKIGDWQMGNDNPVSPTALYGTWKGAIITIDNTKTPSVTSLVNRADPAKNHKNVGPGGTNPPASAIDNGYSTDNQWNLATLVSQGILITGHAYRAQFIVHDGDQNKTGGDVGQACTNIQM